MAKAPRSQKEGMWDDRLSCRVLHLSYDFRTRTGRLDFPADNCCDMAGAIAIFTAIDPEVAAIETYAGGKPDTSFRLDNGSREWKTLMA